MRVIPARAAVTIALVSTCTLAGCAPHVGALCEPLELIYRRDPSAAVTAIDETKLAGSDRDRFLYHAQRGHLLHLARDFKASNREFEAAVAASNELEPASVTGTLTDYTLNEAVKAYAGEDYERAYLHYYMALNYLEMDDLQGALVECRRLDEVFRELDARYEDDGRYQEDGFIRYLSGLIYEAMGHRDDARVDFRLAVDAYEGKRGSEAGVPIPPGLERSLDRLEDPWWPADRSVIPDLAEESDGAEAESESAAVARPVAVPIPARTWSREPQAEIVVVIDSGWAPYKVEKSVQVPIHRALVPEELRGRTNLAALVKVAYPEFVSPGGAGVPFRAGVVDSSGNCAFGRAAEKVQDLDGLARMVLERRKPALVLRSTLRATAKQIALARAKHEREEERDKDSDKRPITYVDPDDGSLLKAVFGWLFENLATHAVAETEQADTRSWVLLPAEIWIARIPVEPGEHEVLVQALDGGEPISVGRVNVSPGEKVFRSARFFGAPHPIRCDD
ncbi:MAG: hypothetical protein ABIE42_00095 [Candidatus Eisenbacteria bacterium]